MSERTDFGIDFGGGLDDVSGTGYSHAAVPAPASAGAPGGDWFRLAEWLPRLGSVLWLHRAAADVVFPRARLADEGVLLLEHPALAALASCTALRVMDAAGTPTRWEWMEWIGADDRCAARMYLLPDTDHLAWDDMIADCAIERAAPPPAASTRLPRLFRRARVLEQAHVVRFPLLRLPCLRVLGLRTPCELSVLGRNAAAAIARAEAAVMQTSI